MACGYRQTQTQVEYDKAIGVKNVRQMGGFFSVGQIT